jgi:hypothetical protein
MEFICNVTDALPITGPEGLADASLQKKVVPFSGKQQGNCNNFAGVHTERVANTPMIVFEFPSLSTVLLRAPTSIMLAEAERAFHDAVCVLINLFQQPVSHVAHKYLLTNITESRLRRWSGRNVTEFAITRRSNQSSYFEFCSD